MIIIEASNEVDRYEKLRLHIDKLRGTSLNFKVSLTENTIIIPEENKIIKYVIKEEYEK